MPDWLIALVSALGGGVVGTLLSTILRISYEREAELRSRMLEAADEFVRAFTAAEETIHAALVKVAPAALVAGRPMSDELREKMREEVEERRREATAAFRAASAARPRIALLFGVNSESAGHAETAIRTVGEALVRVMQADDLTEVGANAMWETTRSFLERSSDRLADFSRAARAAIVSGSARQLLGLRPARPA
ncbi:MAG: hypothetical protein WD249_07500 [Gaiellaceae bacterium]